MSTVESLPATRSFLEEIYAFPGAEALRRCIQCGTCAGTCPNTNYMEHTPRQIVAMVRAGMKEQVLRSNSMWFCVSCYLCSLRCPRGVPLTDIMYSLKNLAIREQFARKGGRTSTLARTFVENINENGRVFEFGVLSKYLWRINLLETLRYIPLGLKLLSRGRMPLRPEGIKAKEQLRAIMKKVASLEGAV